MTLRMKKSPVFEGWYRRQESERGGCIPSGTLIDWSVCLRKAGAHLNPPSSDLRLHSIANNMSPSHFYEPVDAQISSIALLWEITETCYVCFSELRVDVILLYPEKYPNRAFKFSFASFLVYTQLIKANAVYLIHANRDLIILLCSLNFIWL